MILNEYGKIIYDELIKTIEKRPYVFFDTFAIMPNHIHVLMTLKADTARRVPTVEQFGKPTKNSISSIVRAFKSATTNAVRKYVGTQRAVSENMYNIWQRSFYDHIIRNEEDYLRIWQYIDENPAKWTEDDYYVKL